MGKIKVLIADDIEETRKVIIKILNLEQDSFEVVGEACNGEEVLALIPRVKPDIVLMDINMPVLNGLEATEKISEKFPFVTVIIMSVQGENEYLKKAMFYGAKEYIIKPFNYEILIETIKVTYEKYKFKQNKNEINDLPNKEGKIISFFSSKGGVGKSILSLNTGMVLSKERNNKILIIDMDLQFGDISMLVNQYNQKNILDAIEENQCESYEAIKPFLYKYNEKLDILFAPNKPEAAEYINKDSIDKIIKAVIKQYDYIIIDTGINFSDNTLFVLDASHIILYVSTMDIVSLKNTKLGLKVMESLGYDKHKVKLVINRFTTDYGVSKKDVDEIFKDNIFAMLPNEEKIVNISVNQGKPFCDDAKYLKTKLGKYLDGMCKALV